MYRKILVPLDGSETAERGLQEAIDLAQGETTRLLLLNVVEDFPIADTPPAAEFNAWRASLRSKGEALLGRAKRLATEAGAQTDTIVVDAVGDRAAHVIVDTARKHGCDLIAIGTHGRRGFQRMMMGSDAEQVVRLSDVPVLLVRRVAPHA